MTYVKGLVSVVCPFRNEVKCLKEFLDSFINQTYKKIEIILIDNDSSDGSEKIAIEYAKKYKFIKIYHIPHIQGTWATYLYIEAIKKATGEFFYMADANVKVDLDYFEKSLIHFEDPNVAGVVGYVKMWDTNSFIDKYRSIIWKLRYDDMDRVIRETNEGGLLARFMKRSAFNAVGGFDAGAGWAIDTYLNKEFLRKGYKLIYEPKAIWYHKWRDNIPSLWKYSYKFGKFNYALAKTDKKQLLKIGFFLSPFIALVASIFNPYILLYIPLHILVLLLHNLKIFIKASKIKYRWYTFLGPIIAYTQGIAYGFGFIVGIFKKPEVPKNVIATESVKLVTKPSKQ